MSGYKRSFLDLNDASHSALVDLDDDSDDIEHFSMAPINSPERQRKRTKKRGDKLDLIPLNRKHKSRCSCCSWRSCCVILFLVCGIVMCTFGYVAVKAKAEMDDMKEKLNNMDSSSQQFPEQLQSIRAGMQLLQEKVDNGKDVSVFTHQIESIISQIKYLNKTAKQMSDDHATAESLTGLPAEVEQINQNVETLRSTVTSLQTDVDDLKLLRTQIQQKQDVLENRIVDIENRLSTTPSLESPTSNSDSEESQPQISRSEVTALVSSVNTMNQTIISVQERLTQVEKQIDSLPSPDTSGESSVRSLVEAALFNYTQLHQTDFNDLDHRLDLLNSSLSSVQKSVSNHSIQLSHLLTTVNTLQSTVLEAHNRTTAGEEVGGSSATSDDDSHDVRKPPANPAEESPSTSSSTERPSTHLTDENQPDETVNTTQSASKLDQNQPEEGGSETYEEGGSETYEERGSETYEERGSE